MTDEGIKRYILNANREPVECAAGADIGDWALQAYDEDTRRVGHTTIGEARISTVFLGLGYSPDVTFETMVFWPGGILDECAWRTGTWTAAEANHELMVLLVMAEMGMLNRWRRLRLVKVRRAMLVGSTEPRTAMARRMLYGGRKGRSAARRLKRAQKMARRWSR